MPEYSRRGPKLIGALLIVIIAAAPGIAAPVRVENCFFDLPDNNRPTVMCRIHNLSGTAIARFKFRLIVSTAGRAVPWASIGGPEQMDAWRFIPGGINPDETLPVRFALPTWSPRADEASARIDLQILSSEDVHGKEIVDQ